MTQTWDLGTVEFKQYQPGEYGAVSTKAVNDTATGVELVAEDVNNPVRFLNISLPKDNTNYVYCVVGGSATVAGASFILKPTQQNYFIQVNGQQIKAITEAGKTVSVNVQVANGVKV